MQTSHVRRQLGIWEAMVLIAGIAVGLWLFRLAGVWDSSDVVAWKPCLTALYAVLTGLNIAGAPLLLIDRLRTRRHWRSGALLWFGNGVGSWLFAPMIPLDHFADVSELGIAMIFFGIVLPVVSLFMLVACLVGGRPSQRWWLSRGWWPEWFGMWLLVAWSAPGVLLLASFYSSWLAERLDFLFFG